MEIIFYSTNDENNVINKTLNNPKSININLKSGVDVTAPELMLLGDFRGFNYAYIPTLKRYYFISNLEQVNLKFVKVKLQCDVLETYKDDILNSKGIIQRDIADGDYGNVNANSTRNSITFHQSSEKLVLENSIVLTTMEVNNA